MKSRKLISLRIPFVLVVLRLRRKYIPLKLPIIEKRLESARHISEINKQNFPARYNMIMDACCIYIVSGNEADPGSPNAPKSG
jgi:hypothetical protein